MELLPLVCVSLLTWSGTTFAAENEPKVITVEEGDDAILLCSLSSKQDITSKTFDWKKLGQKKKEVFMYHKGSTYGRNSQTQDPQFKERVSHFPDELKSGNASITIRHTKVADSGDYTCVFPNLQPSKTFLIQLVVGGILKDRTGENIPGASPEPYVTILDNTLNSALLHCKVKGAFPKPELHWENSAGTILHAGQPQETKRGERYNINLNIAVKKTDNYSCVAVQKDINHRTDAKTYVLIHEPEVIRLKEGGSVMLPCSLREDITSKKFEWKKDGHQVFLYDAGYHSNNVSTGQDQQFKGRVSHFPDKLKSGDASIIIRNTTVADSGDYTCNFTNFQPRQIFHNRLFVFGEAPKPSVRITNRTKYWALLQCEVPRAFPKPEVYWQARSSFLPNERTVTESDGRYDTSLTINVSKTEIYRCVVTQKEINHLTDAEICVKIWLTPGEIAAMVVALILVLLGLMILSLKRVIIPRNGNYTRTQKTLMGLAVVAVAAVGVAACLTFYIRNYYFILLNCRRTYGEIAVMCVTGIAAFAFIVVLIQLCCKCCYPEENDAPTAPGNRSALGNGGDGGEAGLPLRPLN